MNDIVGFENARDELTKLLESIENTLAEASAEGAESFSNAVLAVTRELVEFTNRTEPADLFDDDEVEAIRKVDRLANEARREIFGDAADAIIARLQDRAAELNQLAKEVRQQAATNEKRARNIRLVPVKNAIDATTGLVESLKDARDSLEDGEINEAEIRSKLDSVLRSISALEKAGKDLLA